MERSLVFLEYRCMPTGRPHMVDLAGSRNYVSNHQWETQISDYCDAVKAFEQKASTDIHYRHHDFEGFVCKNQNSSSTLTSSKTKEELWDSVQSLADALWGPTVHRQTLVANEHRVICEPAETTCEEGQELVATTSMLMYLTKPHDANIDVVSSINAEIAERGTKPFYFRAAGIATKSAEGAVKLHEVLEKNAMDFLRDFYNSKRAKRRLSFSSPSQADQSSVTRGSNARQEIVPRPTLRAIRSLVAQNSFARRRLEFSSSEDESLELTSPLQTPSEIMATMGTYVKELKIASPREKSLRSSLQQENIPPSAEYRSRSPLRPKCSSTRRKKGGAEKSTTRTLSSSSFTSRSRSKSRSPRVSPRSVVGKSTPPTDQDEKDRLHAKSRLDSPSV